MQEYTGWQYLLIDAYNHHQKALRTFEQRIAWTEEHLHMLEDMADTADDKPRYIKAVMAIRAAAKGDPIGHMVSLDASASGMQIMSAITGCKTGAAATGLIDPTAPSDAYSLCSSHMARILGRELHNQKSRLKNAVMTSLYGSVKEPEMEFGEGTEELDAFYQSMEQLAPGAVKLLEQLLMSWQPGTLIHEWQLPDGYEAKARVLEKVESRIRLEELEGASFTYRYHENQGKDWDRKNAANVVHSIDAYIMRSLVRRCSYCPETMEQAIAILNKERKRRKAMGYYTAPHSTGSAKFKYYTSLYRESRMPDLAILPHLTEKCVQFMESAHLEDLWRVVCQSHAHSPFSIVAVHDDFFCHPNNMNHLRRHYANIMADLADSNIIEWVLSQIHNTKGTYTKESENLGDLIRKSAYALH